MICCSNMIYFFLCFEKKNKTRMSVFHSLQTLIRLKIFFPSLISLQESATNDLQAPQFIEPFSPPRIFFFTPAPLRCLILDQASRRESPPNVPFPNPQLTLCNSLTAVAMTIHCRQLTTGGTRRSRPGSVFFYFEGCFRHGRTDVTFLLWLLPTLTHFAH